MRITFLLPGMAANGGIRVLLKHANWLVAHGHQVVICYPTSNMDTGTQLGSRAWLRHKMRPATGVCPFDCDAQLRPVPELSKGYIPHADVCIATTWRTAEWLMRLPLNRGERFYFIQGNEATWDPERERAEQSWHLPVNMIVCSQWLAHVAHQYGVEVLGVARNGVDRAFLVDWEDKRHNEPPQVLLLYSTHPVKGLSDAQEALAICRESGLRFSVAMFGQVVPGDVICGVDKLYCEPAQASIPRIYAESDVFVSASISEGWGLPALEAMAASSAVVTTDCGGVRDFAEQEVSALISEPRDPRALAANIARVVTDSDLRRRLAIEGNATARHLDWDTASAAFENLVVSAARKC